jgi:PKD repeat protein
VVDYDRRVVAFRDETTGKVNWWHGDFGDGTTSAEQHPIHQYREGKDYPVVLEVEGNRGAKKSGMSP